MLAAIDPQWVLAGLAVVGAGIGAFRWVKTTIDHRYERIEAQKNEREQLDRLEAKVDQHVLADETNFAALKRQIKGRDAQA